MSLFLGTKLAHYQIVELVGKGGMGEVYRARDTKLGRDVAIKVLPQEMASDSRRLRRFEQEARAASALNHPNIVHIYEIGQHEGTTYIAMEYVDGATLRAKLSGGALSNDELVRYTIQMAEGLATAHDAGIVHRDLKPENVMIADGGYVKILDFGLAKLLPRGDIGSESVTALQAGTTPGTIVGTAGYMSPEQAKGEAADLRSDQFSFGAVVYEMATGKRAFERDSAAQTLAAIIEDEPEPLTLVNPEVSPGVARVVGRCLSKDPAKRYASTFDIAAELRSGGAAIPTPRARRHPLATVAMAGLLAIVLLMIFAPLVSDLREWLAGETDPPPMESIVVLPLENLSSDPEQEHFADGMTEALITDLARIGALKVISRTSAMRYKDTDKMLPEIARELDVDAVIAGSVLRDGDRVRFTVQLVHAETDHHLWADSYDRDAQDVLALQGEVAQSIAREVAAVLLPEERARLADRHPVDPDAYEAYVKGLAYASNVPEGLPTAVEYFRRAIDRDPEYALAYAGLAQTRHTLAVFGFAPPAEAYSQAKVDASKALELDETLGEAHVVLGDIAFFDWDWSAAQQEYETALRLGPNNPEAYRGMADLFAVQGRMEDALAAARSAWELDPLSVGMNAKLADILYLSREYDQAVERCHRALEIEPESSLIQWLLWRSFHQKGSYREAVSAYAEYVYPGFLSPSGRGAAATLELVFDESGYEAVLLEGAEELTEQWEARADPLTIALSYLHAGKENEGFLWLERAHERREPALPTLIKADPLFDSVRTDARFRDLLRRLSFPIEVR